MPVSGPDHVDEAMPLLRAVLAEARGEVGRSQARRNMAKLLAMQGEFEAAREHLYAGIESLRSAGLLVSAAASAQHIAFVELRAGATDVAEAALREGIDELDRLGNASYRGTTALVLAAILARRGAREEAADWCAAVHDTVRKDDLADAITLNAVEGFLAAQRGELAEGERLSRRAVEVAATIDMYENKARGYEWHARTLAIVGKPAEAREAAAVALAIYEAKGDLPASTWARELLDSL
jgi:tetratricopeptide (TPR) repeat protein